MSWEQVVIGAWLAFIAWVSLKKIASDRDSSPTMMAALVVFALGYVGGLAYVLHSGGFW